MFPTAELVIDEAAHERGLRPPNGEHRMDRQLVIADAAHERGLRLRPALTDHVEGRVIDDAAHERGLRPLSPLDRGGCVPVIDEAAHERGLGPPRVREHRAGHCPRGRAEGASAITGSPDIAEASGGGIPALRQRRRRASMRIETSMFRTSCRRGPQPAARGGARDALSPPRPRTHGSAAPRRASPTARRL